jgi:transposase
MKLSYKIDQVKSKNMLNIAFDVSKDDLYMYSEFGSGKINCIQDHFNNNISMIQSKLAEYKNLAIDNNFGNIQVLCEPTGGYEKKLMHIARQMDCYTAYVNGESVSKHKVMENNEPSKSDIKDPRVILLVGKFGKLIKHRILPEEYELLRNYNRMHEQENEQKIYHKNILSSEIKNLFCDFSFKNSFLYATTGRALLEHFYANPYRITQAGYTKFCRIMKKQVPYVKSQTLERIWDDAQRSARLVISVSMVELLENRIKQLWQNYLHHEQCLKAIKEQMSDIYQKLLDAGEALPRAEKGFVSQTNLARIAGETGPLPDFNHASQLIRFGGMGLRLRQSGKFKGQDKITKKGRSRLRLILSQSIFHLVKKDRVFGELYHRKKAEGMPGAKAMVVVSRKLLEVLFALSKPGAVYDPERLFTCKSEFKKVA